MTSSSTRLLLAASILFTTGAATGMAVQNSQAKPDEATSSPAKDEELASVGKTTTEMVCAQCHGMEDVIARRRTSRDWNEVVTTMVDRGANATDEDVATVKRYLMRYYGSVQVNTASASDLSNVLGLSSKDANAVVEFRNAHGKFTDAAALSKVPGIDKTKIDAQPDALHFD